MMTKKSPPPKLSPSNEKNSEEVAIFGGGCFWCVEAAFAMAKGVRSVTPGYTGGVVEKPTYEQVCTGTTGHVEVTKIKYDPKVISYKQLLDLFFSIHDPTTLNRQGNDIGKQYQSAIFYFNNKQQSQAQTYLSKLNQSGRYDSPIITTIRPLRKFYAATAEHQHYYQKNPDQAYCRLIIAPKLKKINREQRNLLQ